MNSNDKFVIIFRFFPLKVYAHSDNDNEDDELQPDLVYVKYSFKQYAVSANLPIYESNRDILKALDENQVVVIEGCTGCGKSTQVSVL